MSLARRSITSAFWSIAASPAKIVVLFFRSILLAQLLPVETFGTYALASSIITLSAIIPEFGMAVAFIHRADETKDEALTAAVYFTLKFLFILVWIAVLVLGAILFTEGLLRTALLLILFTSAGIQLTQTPRLILNRRVVHRRLALLDFSIALLTALVAVGLARRGATLWALLSTDVVSLILLVFGLYIWRPVWRPRLIWHPAGMRYFLHFGSRSFLAALLSQALDRIDDLWTGFYLGENALGLYSRAYAFATYPREVLARPVNMIALGTYAELKGNRPILSQAFFRSNALLIRGGFLMAGTLALVAPEFIRLLLGDKWLPMLDAFRLMLLFTMLDPIKSTVSKLFAAVGEPERAAKIRLVQLVILVGGLFLLGPNLGITGVAISVNLMLAVGMGLLFWQVRRFVDYSLRQLFLAPGLSLLLGLILTQGALSYFQVSGSDWLVGGSKLIIFLVVYGITLLLMERRQIKMLTNLLKQQIFNKARV